MSEELSQIIARMHRNIDKLIEQKRIAVAALRAIPDAIDEVAMAAAAIRALEEIEKIKMEEAS